MTSDPEKQNPTTPGLMEDWSGGVCDPSGAAAWRPSLRLV